MTPEQFAELNQLIPGENNSFRRSIMQLNLHIDRICGSPIDRARYDANDIAHLTLIKQQLINLIQTFNTLEPR